MLASARSLPATAPRAGELILGVRPEHLTIAEGPNGHSGWPLTVEMIETLGAERLIYGRMSPGAGLVTVRVDSGDRAPALGQTVQLAVQARHLHWFDAGTHHRL